MKTKFTFFNFIFNSLLPKFIFIFVSFLIISISGCTFLKLSVVRINNKTDYDIVVTIENNLSTEKINIKENKSYNYQTLPKKILLIFSDNNNYIVKKSELDIQYGCFYEIDYKN